MPLCSYFTFYGFSIFYALISSLNSVGVSIYQEQLFKVNSIPFFIGDQGMAMFMFYLFSENMLDLRAVLIKIRCDIEVFKKIKSNIFMSSEFKELEEAVNFWIG